MKKLLFAWLVLFLLNACLFTPKYKEGISSGNKLQLDKISSIASQSSNIIDFVSKVYNVKPENLNSNYIEVEGSISKGSSIKTVDLDLYEVYARSKAGVLNKWVPFMDRQSVLYVNEVGGNVESVLAYRTWRRKDYSGEFPYEYSIDYMTKNGFDEYVKNNGNIKTYISSNKTFSIIVHGTYTLRVSFENKEKTPVVIDLNEAKLVYDGAEYGVEFEQNRDTNHFYWNSYTSGAFEKNSDLGKLKLNPGQEFSGQIDFTVKGLKANDLTGASLHLGSVTVESLKLVGDYDAHKDGSVLKNMDERRKLLDSFNRKSEN